MVHRELFHRKVLGTSSSDEVSEYVPNPNQANLRSKRQLTDGCYIVRHWHTGTNEHGVDAFRSLHKSYDALFEIHCLECDHAGGVHAMKERASEMYANLPEGQMKAFLEACPVCVRKRTTRSADMVK